jgi:hypothetical protein
VQQHRWLSIAVLVVVILSSAGGTCWAVFFRTVASPVTLREALRLYRRAQAGPNVPTKDGPTITTAAPVLLPGVFSYATSGSERLNLLGVSRSFPANTGMVTTDGPGPSCSTISWIPLVEHTETTSVCQATGHALSVRSLITHETIGGSTTTTVINCPDTAYFVPPTAAPEARWVATCHQVDPSEQVSLVGLDLGTGTSVVGGNSVATLHVRLSFTFSGTDQGTSPDDFWISTSRGVIVREREVTNIAQGAIHYVEVMDTQLKSLTPVR